MFTYDRQYILHIKCFTRSITFVHLSSYVWNLPASKGSEKKKTKTQQCHIKHASRKHICCGSKCYILIIRRYYLRVTTLKPVPFAIICCRIKSFVITATRWRAAWKMCNLVIPEWNNLLLHSTLFKYWLKVPAWLHYCQAAALCAELLSLTWSPSITHVFLI